ncbi:MAG: hypothetical protein AB7S78_14295 [Candidatus Omnitrophota bacterium]
MGFAIRFIFTAFLFILPVGLQGCTGKVAEPSPLVKEKQQPEEPIFIGKMKVCWGKEACKP